MSVEVSVIVPTHNRLEILPEVLAALDAQIGAPEFELLVVDDGSDDGTAEWLERWLSQRLAKHPARMFPYRAMRSDLGSSRMPT